MNSYHLSNALKRSETCEPQFVLLKGAYSMTCSLKDVESFLSDGYHIVCRCANGKCETFYKTEDRTVMHVLSAMTHKDIHGDVVFIEMKETYDFQLERTSFIVKIYICKNEVVVAEYRFDDDKTTSKIDSATMSFLKPDLYAVPCLPDYFFED